LNKQNKIKLLIERAQEDLGAAAHLLQEGHNEIAASRIYYAMFYAAQAALLQRDLEFGKHSAVIARFGKEFAKTGDLDPGHLNALQNAFTLRNEGDYSLLRLSDGDVRPRLDEARALVADVRAMLEKQGYGSGDEG